MIDAVDRGALCYGASATVHCFVLDLERDDAAGVVPSEPLNLGVLANCCYGSSAFDVAALEDDRFDRIVHSFVKLLLRSSPS